MLQHPVLLRFRKLRKDHVRHTVLKPNKKRRHERVDVKQLIKKSEESYVDFQTVPWFQPCHSEICRLLALSWFFLVLDHRFVFCLSAKKCGWQVSKLVPLKEYLEQHAKVKKQFKSERERKSYITNTLKLSVQKDPKKGTLCVPIEGDTLMLSGKRMSASRVKEEEHESKDEAKESFHKASEGLQGSTNSKAGRRIGMWVDREG